MVLARHTREHLPLIAQQVDLRLALALDPDIPLPSSPLAILCLQSEMGSNTTTKQKERQVSQHDSMAELVSRSILRAVDVARHNAVQIAPADHEAQSDSALVHAFGIIGAPGNRVGDAGVDAQSAEEGTCVFDAWSILWGA